MFYISQCTIISYHVVVCRFYNISVTTEQRYWYKSTCFQYLCSW